MVFSSPSESELDALLWSNSGRMSGEGWGFFVLLGTVPEDSRPLDIQLEGSARWNSWISGEELSRVGISVPYGGVFRASGSGR